MIKQILKSIVEMLTLRETNSDETESGLPIIDFDPKIKSAIKNDWVSRFPISGDSESCARFIEIIDNSLFSGVRVDGSCDELLELVASGSVVLEPIVEFQRKANGRYKLVNRKAIITDKNLDEIPYGTLSSLLKNDPKACLQAFQLGVTNYMMQKYHVARYISSGVTKGRISTIQTCSRKCKLDKNRIVALDLDSMIIPHYLGCGCHITPLVKF